MGGLQFRLIWRSAWRLRRIPFTLFSGLPTAERWREAPPARDAVSVCGNRARE